MRLARAVRTFGGVGLIPGPAGVWGSAAAIPLAWLLHGLGGFPLLALATCGLFALGWWAAGVGGGRDLDPRHAAVGDVVGQWIALWPLSLGLWHMGAPGWLFPWPGWVGAFLVFRLLDATKPGPVGWAARREGAAGAMLGDVVAGALAAAAVALAAAVAHGWLA